jgi:hypothetical protein
VCETRGIGFEVSNGVANIPIYLIHLLDINLVGKYALVMPDTYPVIHLETFIQNGSHEVTTVG